MSFSVIVYCGLDSLQFMAEYTKDVSILLPSPLPPSSAGPREQLIAMELDPFDLIPKPDPEVRI